MPPIAGAPVIGAAQGEHAAGITALCAPGLPPFMSFFSEQFYPLNYGNNDHCDFRFSTADCKQRTASSI